jgi:hypothetical protein
MAELQKKPRSNEDQLTTADLAGRADNPPQNRPPEAQNQEWAGKPTLVRKEEERAPAESRNQPSSSQPVASTSLFTEGEVTELRDRWTDVQSAFVDEPRKAVEQADKLVATAMKRLAEGFANERSNLEKQWARGGDVSTEDLRVAMQRYRSFFDRLLNA